MVRPAKQRAALLAINSVLVTARYLAYQGQAKELADVLDVAEYLPMLMLEEGDQTDAFRGQLVGLAEELPLFRTALSRFDAEEQQR